LEDLIERYRTREFNEKSMAELRAEMEDLGLSRMVPSTISRLAEKKENP
jgi:hypothetical protein